jgi:hypothetical protein
VVRGLTAFPYQTCLIDARQQKTASHFSMNKYKKRKAISVTGRGDPWGCETSRLPHFLENRITDGGEVVSLTPRQASLYPQEDSWYAFLLEAESTPGP